ncbi:inactive ubiquitin carboxyl-terminal hydrolase 53 isoform X2 [Latimeria chalumnae]|uniref:inactive ubiquitin carboxyl-terminal hydrolase 53 isoform X2 n=1 Tax=Latimeria chalumnae TaxID=7897 RepID=UPI00313E9EB4
MAWVKFFKKPGGNLGKSYQPGSMLSLAPTKGLLNAPGQNSCFLNSAVQVLWQLDIFRRSFRQLPGHTCMGEACIFCALKSMFAQFQHSPEKALPSDILRNALAESFKDEHRFQLGLMDDAAECFENILERIHFHIVPNSEADMCTSKSCITHQKFAMTLYEQSVCRSCGATSDPLPFVELVHYVSITALCNQVDRMIERHERLKPDMFGELLQAASTAGDYRNCPSNCGQKIKIRRVLMNCPEIVTIGLVWDSENSDLTEDVIRYLGPQLFLPGLFYRVTDEQAKRSELLLVGMVCYSNKHYCAFAYHTKSSKWVFFDDAHVKEVGSKWKDVVSKCVRCHFQPLLLFYSNPGGAPISLEDAPKQVVQSLHNKMMTNEDDLEVSGSGSKKVYHAKANGIGSYSNSSNQKIQSTSSPGSNRGLMRGNVQGSGGRGPVKITPGDQRDRLGDIAKESAQKVGDGRISSQSHRKEPDRGQRRLDSGRHSKEDRSSSKSASPPVGNGFKSYLDQRAYGSQGKGPYRQDKPAQQVKPLRDTRPSRVQVLPVVESPHSKARNDTSAGYDTDSSQESNSKASSRSRTRGWKPTRETLNVDSIFNGTEKRQNSPRHKPSPTDRPRYGKEYSHHWTKDDHKPKSLMTIYEDEQKQETGSRSSLESEGKGSTEKEKVKNHVNLKVRSENGQMHRTESGYESSDRLSSGSISLDSPVVDGANPKDIRSVTESGSCSDQLQSRKVEALRSENLHLNFQNNRNKVEEGDPKIRIGLEKDYKLQDCASSETYMHKPSPKPHRAQHCKNGFEHHHQQSFQTDSCGKTRLSANEEPSLPNHYETESRDMRFNGSNTGHTPRLPRKQNSADRPSSEVSHNLPSALKSHPKPVPSVGVKKSSDRLQEELAAGLLCAQQQQHPGVQTAVLRPKCSDSMQPGHIAEQSRFNPISAGEQNLNQGFEKSNANRIDSNYQNLPPPLPPKKYTRRAVPNLEKTAPVASERPMADLLRANASAPSKCISSAAHRPEVSSVLHNCWTNEAILEYELSIPETDDDPSLEWKKSSITTPEGLNDAVSLNSAPDAGSSGAKDNVSLTTYFSVDSCMTDTYRTRYHERAKLYFVESSGLEENGDEPSPAEMGAMSQNSPYTPCTLMEQRSNSNLDSAVTMSPGKSNMTYNSTKEKMYW